MHVNGIRLTGDYDDDYLLTGDYDLVDNEERGGGRYGTVQVPTAPSEKSTADGSSHVLFAPSTKPETFAE